MSFQIQILGSSSAIPTKDRNQTALLLSFPSQSILFDAGEGVQKQLMIYQLKGSRISHILISHLHPDHFIGLVGLLCSWGLSGRKKQLTILAPEGMEEIILVQLKYAGIELQYPVAFRTPPSENGVLTLTTNQFTVRSYRLKHRIDCFGYVLKENKHEPTLLIDKANADELPVEAYRLFKQKRNFVSESGTVFSWQDYTGPPPPEKSFAYFTDTSIVEELAPSLNGVDILYHDSTFLNNLSEKAAQTGHSTALQAASFAHKSKVKKLILGHFSTRYEDLDRLKKEARTAFNESYLATEGAIFTVNN